jgi:hypothetical protein
MKCNDEWSREFLVNNLSRSFVNGDYKKHREILLLGTEKARLVEDMEAAAAFKEMDVHKAEQKLLNEQIRKLKQKRYKTEQNIWRLKRVFQGFENPEKKRKEFIKKCPSESCNGMLSTQWKCQICELTVCPKCHEIKEDPSNGGGDEHICKQENIDSVKFIKKDTKGCPGCGTDIHKISGCDQMWCPQCKKAFSWKSGQVITHGIIHNPHFHAWQREQARRGVLAAPRAPGDIVCGGLPGNHQWFELVKILHPNPTRMRRWYGRGPGSSLKKETLWEMVQDIHRKIAHFQAVLLEPIRREVNALNDNRQLRINYIIGKINDEQFASQLSRKALKKEKATAALHIYELINTVLTENLVNLWNKRLEWREPNALESLAGLLGADSPSLPQYMKCEAKKTLQKCHEIRLYANEELKKISVIYGQTIKGFNSIFDIFSMKYTKTSLDREKNKKKQTAEMTGLTIEKVQEVIDGVDAIY